VDFTSKKMLTYGYTQPNAQYFNTKIRQTNTIERITTNAPQN